jgi:hypothetical protein
VLIFVDHVLVNRLGTLGAPDRIDQNVVLDVLDTDDIRHHAFCHAKLFFGAYASGESDDVIVNVHVDVVRIEKELLVESVLYERTELVVAQIVDVVDVLIILFHTSSASALGGAVQVT